MKYKILLTLFLLTLLIMGFGLTYSFFYSTNSSSVNQQIAKFVFNTEMTDELKLPLIDLEPGFTKDYNFQVSNSNESAISNVTIEYTMTIKTYHLIPLTIELYKGDDSTPLLICDESGRNSFNEVVCNVDPQEMPYTSEALDNYRLKITFPSEYNSEIYSGLVDYIDLEIKSSQKIKR